MSGAHAHVAFERAKRVPHCSRRMEAVLEELGVGSRPLPTAAVSEAYNSLRSDIVSLMELQSSLGTDMQGVSI